MYSWVLWWTLWKWYEKFAKVWVLLLENSAVFQWELRCKKYVIFSDSLQSRFWRRKLCNRNWWMPVRTLPKWWNLYWWLLIIQLHMYSWVLWWTLWKWYEPGWKQMLTSCLASLLLSMRSDKTKITQWCNFSYSVQSRFWRGGLLNRNWWMPVWTLPKWWHMYWWTCILYLRMYCVFLWQPVWKWYGLHVITFLIVFCCSLFPLKSMQERFVCFRMSIQCSLDGSPFLDSWSATLLHWLWRALWLPGVYQWASTTRWRKGNWCHFQNRNNREAGPWTWHFGWITGIGCSGPFSTQNIEHPCPKCKTKAWEHSQVTCTILPQVQPICTQIAQYWYIQPLHKLKTKHQHELLCREPMKYLHNKCNNITFSKTQAFQIQIVCGLNPPITLQTWPVLVVQKDNAGQTTIPNWWIFVINLLG